MERKTLKQFHKNLSLSTRIYTLLTIVTIAFSYYYDAWNSNWVKTIILALAIILFVETFEIMFYNHPKTWKTIRWILILILLAFLLIGFIPNL
jgi:hypothetical protein